MKKYLYVFAVVMLTLTACEYDNYDEPQSQLTGRFVYEEDSVGVRQGITVIQLYEHGWDNFDPIGVRVKQDGTFSALLFDGEYKLILIKNNGPWVNQQDTIDVFVRGSESIEIPVEPFFMIRNETIDLNDNTLSATFDIEQIVDARELQFVSLYIGETRLVDNRYNAGEERLPSGRIDDLDQTIHLEMDVSGINRDFVYARIGVKTRGNSELIFSPVRKIALN